MMSGLVFAVAVPTLLGVIFLNVLAVRWLVGGRDGLAVQEADEPLALPNVRYTDIRRCAAHGGPIEEDFPVEVHTDIALYDREHPLAVTLFICQPCTSVASYGR